MTQGIEALAQWLAEGKCSHVAMESTGVYWQPIYNLLEGRFELFLVNAQSIKRMPGRKTDMKDAEWIATLMQHGLLSRSFIPSHEQRALRDLARYRVTLMQERNRIANRLQKVLEGANLKLSSVVSDMQGASAQAILHALLAGETDPKVLAELCQGKLRKKRDQVQQALVGRLQEHQRFVLSELLEYLDFLDEQTRHLDEQIEAQLVNLPTFRAAVELLDTLPGVSRQLAILIVAEIGIDMSRFPSDRHLTAWAGMAPGNNESGGRQRSGKTRKGNKYLRWGLAVAAHAAAKTKGKYLQALYHRVAARRGKSRAAVAVGRTILQSAYHMLQRHQSYQDLGGDYFDRLDRERTSKRLMKRLQMLGFEITVKEHIESQPNASPHPPGPSLPLAA